MKLKKLLPVVALITFVCTASSPADLTIHYDFGNGNVVPDGFGQLSDVKILGGLSGLADIDQVVTRLNLTTGTAGNPMYLGDLYSSLTFGQTGETQKTAVLLNRPGRDDTHPFGSDFSSLNVTLDDSAIGTNVWGATTTTGTYNSDGRLGVDPNAAGVAFTGGSNSLTTLEGATFASNRVSLLVADFSGGGMATLSGWGVSVTGTAATTGSFAPGANASLSDNGTGATMVGAILNTSNETSGSLTINLAGTMTFSNGVIGTGGINKTGAGTLVLEGASSYTGPTSVGVGTLIATGNGSAATGNVSISGAGTRLGGTGTIGGNTTISTGAIHSAGGVTVDKVGIQTFDKPAEATTSLTYAAGSIFEWDINGNTKTQEGAGTMESPYVFDQIIGSGTLTVNETADTGTIFRVILGSGVDAEDGFWNTPNATRTWDNIFSGFGTVVGGFDSSNLQVVGSGLSGIGTFTISGTSLTWTAVPEPTSALAGLLITAGLLRRRRKN
ncbi:MAG: autotransporter-associated beta strand repeat-containing protein [Luteolibacter sp.]